jgi:hypothetical protein
MPKRAKARERTRAPLSFRDFARGINGSDPFLAAFKTQAMSDEFPNTDEWREIRYFLVRNSAPHEA